MKPLCSSGAISLALLLLLPQLAMAAGDDHGHDHGDVAPTASGPALPRFAAVSDLFELVGVLEGKQITLYLDRAGDNSPVTEAQVELEIGDKKYQAARHGAGEFEVVLPDAPAPGVLPITATVSAGAESDLLAGELDIHDGAHTDEATHLPSWKDYAGWAAGGIAVLTALLMAGRRVVASRQTRIGGAA